MQELLIRRVNRDKARRMSLQEQHDRIQSNAENDPELKKKVEQVKNELSARGNLLG